MIAGIHSQNCWFLTAEKCWFYSTAYILKERPDPAVINDEEEKENDDFDSDENEENDPEESDDDEGEEA